MKEGGGPLVEGRLAAEGALVDVWSVELVRSEQEQPSGVADFPVASPRQELRHPLPPGDDLFLQLAAGPSGCGGVLAPRAALVEGIRVE